MLLFDQPDWTILDTFSVFVTKKDSGTGIVKAFNRLYYRRKSWKLTILDSQKEESPPGRSGGLPLGGINEINAPGSSHKGRQTFSDPVMHYWLFLLIPLEIEYPKPEPSIAIIPATCPAIEAAESA